MPGDPTPHDDELSFEEAMLQLEALVVELEREDVGLEQSLLCYEQGVSLARMCLDRLERAELQVKELSVKSTEIRA